jgi:shikimate dehydrogenase
MRITASTPLYAVMGNPIHQSLSPILHNGWLAEFGYDGVYVAFDIDPNHFEAALIGLSHAGLQGGNITAPFKERAASGVAQLTPRAKAIGSVNCLTQMDGGFIGDTTDGDGFIADLDQRAQGWRDNTGPVVILGAGGAARALLYALYNSGRRDIVVVNRTLARAQTVVDLVNDERVMARPLEALDLCLKEAGLVINASSAGLAGSVSIAPDFSNTAANCLIYDTVYAPKDTAFLMAAQEAGRQNLGGLGMLVGQGGLAFENWFGVRPDFKTGLARLEKAIAP